MRPEFRGSRLPVGSSASTSRGESSRARHRAARCRSPCESRTIDRAACWRIPTAIEDVEVIDQLKILENQSNVLQSKKSSGGVSKLSDAGAVNDDPAGFGREDSGNQIQQRGLSRATGACHHNGLTILDSQLRYMQPKDAVSVGEPKLFDLDHDAVQCRNAVCSAAHFRVKSICWAEAVRARAGGARMHRRAAAK
jgi:hypothetical protein